jgi:hypothetical protein
MGANDVYGRPNFQFGALRVTGASITGATGAVDFATATTEQRGGAITPTVASDYLLINEPGLYRVCARLHGTGTTAKYNRLAIYKNAAALTQICTQQITALTGRLDTDFNLERVLWLESGDYLTLYLTVEAAGSCTIVEVDFTAQKII